MDIWQTIEAPKTEATHQVQEVQQHSTTDFVIGFIVHIIGTIFFK